MLNSTNLDRSTEVFNYLNEGTDVSKQTKKPLKTYKINYL